MKLLTSNLRNAIFISFIISLSINAQQPDSTLRNITSLHKGSWSLQFAYNNQLGFNTFKGGNISAKYHFTDHSALRFGFNINFASNTSTRTNNAVNHNPPFISNNDLDNIDISINTDYVYYVTTQKRINLFVSGGTVLGVGYNNTNSKDFYSPPDSVAGIGSNKTNSILAGINFSIGVEWFLTSSFSIHGEYQTSVIYRYLKMNLTETKFGSYGAIRIINQTRKTFDFSPGGLLIGVSLYF